MRDEQGYNQIFPPSLAMQIRTQRRANYIADQIYPTCSTNSKILEIGCGTAEMTKMLSEQLPGQIIACDVSAKFLAQATYTASPRITFIHGDFREVAAQHAPFDFIIGNGILHHLYYSLEKDLLTIKNLLTPQGKIVFLEPNLYNPYCWLIFTIPLLRKLARLDPDEKAFSKKFITHHLTKANFQNIKVEYHDFLLPNTPDKLITLLCKTGDILEQTPLRYLTQSLFISAEI